MSDARETIAGCLDFGGQCETCFCSDETRCEVGAADKILSALSATPLASRLALARALVPGWAVVPVEPSRQMMECAVVRHYNKGSLAEVWTAMLTAAEEPPHGP